MIVHRQKAPDSECPRPSLVSYLGYGHLMELPLTLFPPRCLPHGLDPQIGIAGLTNVSRSLLDSSSELPVFDDFGDVSASSSVIVLGRRSQRDAAECRCDFWLPPVQS